MAVDRSDYWYFNRAITPKRCKHIIDLAHKEGFHRGSISKEQITNTKVRKSEVCFLNKQFLFDLINTFLPGANKSAAWNFEYSWIEDIQITKYETGDHYDWHMDSTLVPYDDPKKTNIYGKVRKISVILPLSDPKTYGGGNFQLSFGKAKTAGFDVRDVRKKPDFPKVDESLTTQDYNKDLKPLDILFNKIENDN